MEPEQPTLTTICGGAAVELFDDELQKVLRNIQDPNTKADAVREIVIRIKVAPNEERDAARAFVQVTSRLEPGKGASTTLYLGGASGGRFQAVEHDPKQLGLDFAPHVASFDIKKGGKE